jgi:hypothetical protein
MKQKFCVIFLKKEVNIIIYLLNQFSLASLKRYLFFTFVQNFKPKKKKKKKKKKTLHGMCI